MTIFKAVPLLVLVILVSQVLAERPPKVKNVMPIVDEYSLLLEDQIGSSQDSSESMTADLVEEISLDKLQNVARFFDQYDEQKFEELKKQAPRVYLLAKTTILVMNKHKKELTKTCDNDEFMRIIDKVRQDFMDYYSTFRKGMGLADGFADIANTTYGQLITDIACIENPDVIPYEKLVQANQEIEKVELKSALESNMSPDEAVRMIDSKVKFLTNAPSRFYRAALQHPSDVAAVAIRRKFETFASKVKNLRWLLIAGGHKLNC